MYLSSDLEETDDWAKWVKEIPFIPMKNTWQVKPIPPFRGAIARFLISLPDGRTKSIYLDCYDRLGVVGEPYWEVHPCHGDVDRCLMEDTDKLIELIECDSDDPDEEPLE